MKRTRRTGWRGQGWGRRERERGEKRVEGWREELYATGEGKEHTVEGNKKLMGV